MFQRKEEIEKVFGSELTWERLDDKVTARVKCELKDVNIFNKDDWSKMIAFMVSVVPKFENAFKKPIQELTRLKI